MPQFTVIIPNYNHAAFLRQRIDSVIQQTEQDFELIILDDASTDSSREIIEQYRKHPKVSAILYNPTNTGSPFLQWRKGIEAAKGEWIWVAESDDLASTGFLQAALAASLRNPELNLFYSDACIIDENGNPGMAGKFSEIKNAFFETDKWSHNYSKKGIDELNEHLGFACTINNAGSAVFRKKQAIGMLNELATFRYHGDWFAYIKLALEGEVVYTSQALVSVRAHTESLINKKSLVKSKKELFRILLLLLKQKNITNKRKLRHFFSEQYLSSGVFKDGFGKSLGSIASYFSIDPILAMQVLGDILRIKMSGRYVKPVF
jgi:glycosyltransferase involved in cell wall biosynthesis